jgi:hypothetical protein
MEHLLRQELLASLGITVLRALKARPNWSLDCSMHFVMDILRFVESKQFSSFVVVLALSTVFLI